MFDVHLRVKCLGFWSVRVVAELVRRRYCDCCSLPAQTEKIGNAACAPLQRLIMIALMFQADSRIWPLWLHASSLLVPPPLKQNPVRQIPSCWTMLLTVKVKNQKSKKLNVSILLEVVNPLAWVCSEQQVSSLTPSFVTSIVLCRATTPAEFALGMLYLHNPCDFFVSSSAACNPPSSSVAPRGEVVPDVINCDCVAGNSIITWQQWAGAASGKPCQCAACI
jgi:hypothetical protein